MHLYKPGFTVNWRLVSGMMYPSRYLVWKPVSPVLHCLTGVVTLFRLPDGGYTLQGTVDVYGPRLTITNGSISFPSVPANNPLLNIRAGRDIFGNTQTRSAGVQVIGSLKRPVLEAYTVPVTNEDRAWTLLITGTDFDQGQGVSGFDVGTYIAPKLYVSYGISLFDDENVISARYDFKKGFGVKVTSGQRETGLDVSYTIDK